MNFLLLLIVISFSSAANGKDCVVERKLPSMGAFFELQIRQDCLSSEPKQLYLEVQKSLDLLEADLSLYQAKSSIQSLNQSGSLSVAPKSLYELVQLSIKAGDDTRGAFDVTIWPVLVLIQEHFKNQSKEPSSTDLERLRPLVNYKLVQLTETGIQFQKKNVMITLDGIAKGYAVDKIAAMLAEKGFKNYLLNFSGNIKWQGSPEEGKSWSISRWNSVTLKPEKVAAQTPAAIASSGPEHNTYTKNQRWHHLLNPKTLRPSNLWVGTTVTGPSATICDILSTAAFTMSDREIRRALSENYPDYRVWTVDSRGKSHCHIGKRAPHIKNKKC